MFGRAHIFGDVESAPIQRLREFRPSIVPGIWISVKSSAISERDSRIAIASSASTGLDRCKAGILHHIERAHAQQYLIFDDENDNRNDGVIQDHDGGYS
jgi:hypothetical protein